MDLLQCMKAATEDGPNRETAEEQLVASFEQNPGEAYKAALSALNTPVADIGVMAVLLRRFIVGGNKEGLQLAETQSPGVIAALQTKALQMLAERDEKRRSAGSRVVSALAEVFEEAWPEACTATLEMSCSPDESLAATGLTLLNEAHTAWMAVFKGAGEARFKQTLATNLVRADRGVKCRGLAACFVLNVGTEIKQAAGRKPLRQFAPCVVGVLPAVINLPNSEPAQRLLSALADCAALGIDLVKDQLNELMQVLGQLAMSTMHDEDDVPMQALSTMAAFASTKYPKTLLKNCPNFPAMLMEIIATVIAKVEQPADWTKLGAEQGGVEEGNFDELENVHIAVECLDQCVKNLGIEATRTTLLAAVEKLFLSGQNGPFGLAFAAGQFVRMTVEFLTEEVDVAAYMKVASELCSHQHPMVRFSAWQAVGQIGEDHTDTAPAQHWETIYRLISVNIAQEPVDKVKAMALSVAFSYIEPVDDTQMVGHLDGILKVAMDTAKSQAAPPVIAEALTVVGVTASKAGKDFAPFYPHFMEPMRSVLTAGRDKTTARMRGKAIECISFMGGSVPEAQFRGDAVFLMNYIVENKQIDAGIEREYCQSALGTLAHSLGASFAEFLPGVLPRELQRLEMKTAPEAVVDVDVNVKVVDSNGNVRYVRSDEMEELSLACANITTYATECGADFFPHVQASAKALAPYVAANDESGLFTLELLNDVYFCWGELILVCSKAAKAGNAQASDLGKELVQSALHMAATAATKEDSQNDHIAMMLLGISRVLDSAKEMPGSVTDKQASGLCDMTMKRIDAAYTEDMDEATADEAGVDDEEELDEGADELDDQSNRECVTYGVELVASLMATNPAFMLSKAAQLNALMGSLLKSINEKRVKNADSSPVQKVKRAGVCAGLLLAARMCETLKEQGVPLWPSFMAAFPSILNHAHSDVRQAAAFVINRAAKCATFHVAAAATMEVLCQVVARGDRKGKRQDQDSDRMVMDNVVGAQFFLLAHHSGQFSADQQRDLWAGVVRRLPLTYDDEISAEVTEAMLEACKTGNVAIMGAQQERAGPILGALAIAHGSGDTSIQSQREVEKLVKGMPRESLTKLAPTLTAKQMKRIERIFEAA